MYSHKQKNLQFVPVTKTPKRLIGDDENLLNKSGRESFSNASFIKKAVISPRLTSATSPYSRQSKQKDTSLLYSTAGVSRPTTATTYSSTTNPSRSNVSGILKQDKEKEQKPKQQPRAASPTGRRHLSWMVLISNKGSLKVYKGPFHVNSISSKSPKYIMSEINRAIDGLKVYYKIVKYLF